MRGFTVSALAEINLLDCGSAPRADHCQVTPDERAAVEVAKIVGWECE